MKRKNLVMLIIGLICLIVIVLYLLILHLGYIRNKNYLTPTGNVDIFEIDCNCDNKDDNCNDNEQPVFNEDNTNGKDDNIDKDKHDMSGLIVSDDYTIWDNKRARIFSNPAYEYTSKIAPGSFNSYAFVIKNNNDFDVVVDFVMVEENPYQVNMNYKLSSRGNFLVGNNDTYEDISKLQLKNIKINAHESIPYILDWKWIDSENDTEIGERIEADYKLTINVGANQVY